MMNFEVKPYNSLDATRNDTCTFLQKLIQQVKLREIAEGALELAQDLDKKSVNDDSQIKITFAREFLRKLGIKTSQLHSMTSSDIMTSLQGACARPSGSFNEIDVEGTTLFEPDVEKLTRSYKDGYQGDDTTTKEMQLQSYNVEAVDSSNIPQNYLQDGNQSEAASPALAERTGNRVTKSEKQENVKVDAQIHLKVTYVDNCAQTDVPSAHDHEARAGQIELNSLETIRMNSADSARDRGHSDGSDRDRVNSIDSDVYFDAKDSQENVEKTTKTLPENQQEDIYTSGETTKPSGGGQDDDHVTGSDVPVSNGNRNRGNNVSSSGACASISGGASDVVKSDVKSSNNLTSGVALTTDSTSCSSNNSENTEKPPSDGCHGCKSDGCHGGAIPKHTDHSAKPQTQHGGLREQSGNNGTHIKVQDHRRYRMNGHSEDGFKSLSAADLSDHRWQSGNFSRYLQDVDERTQSGPGRIEGCVLPPSGTCAQRPSDTCAICGLPLHNSAQSGLRVKSEHKFQADWLPKAKYCEKCELKQIMKRSLDPSQFKSHSSAGRLENIACGHTALSDPTLGFTAPLLVDRAERKCMSLGTNMHSIGLQSMGQQSFNPHSYRANLFKLRNQEAKAQREKHNSEPQSPHSEGETLATGHRQLNSGQTSEASSFTIPRTKVVPRTKKKLEGITFTNQPFSFSGLTIPPLSHNLSDSASNTSTQNATTLSDNTDNSLNSNSSASRPSGGEHRSLQTDGASGAAAATGGRLFTDSCAPVTRSDRLNGVHGDKSSNSKSSLTRDKNTTKPQVSKPPVSNSNDPDLEENRSRPSRSVPANQHVSISHVTPNMNQSPGASSSPPANQSEDITPTVTEQEVPATGNGSGGNTTPPEVTSTDAPRSNERSNSSEGRAEVTEPLTANSRRALRMQRRQRQRRTRNSTPEGATAATNTTNSTNSQAEGAKTTTTSKPPAPPTTAAERSAMLKKFGLEDDEPEVVDPEEVRRENRRLKAARRCGVCKDHDADRLFLPCAHISACSLCTPALTKCPQCRSSVRGIVSVYFG